VSEKKRIRIESNGRAEVEGDTRVFIDGVDVTRQVYRVTWNIGAHRDENHSRASITFNDVELAVEYVAEELAPSEQVTAVPAEYFDELVADLDAPDEPNERVKAAARRLPDVVRRDEEPDA
jgi:hypothetical protein